MPVATHLNGISRSCESSIRPVGVATFWLALPNVSQPLDSVPNTLNKSLLHRYSEIYGASILIPSPVSWPRCICMQPVQTMFYPHRRGQAPPLHIHQADALTLRWNENANIDLFLANPPYLAAKNNDLSSYRTMQGHGQSDSYLLFVQLALRVTRPHGWIGLVLPDPLLARINARQTRHCLLTETTIHHLWHLAGVFPAGVGAVVIVAQKCTPKRLHAISWQRERWSTFLTRQAQQPSSILDGYTTLPAGASRAKFVTQSLLLNQPHAELRYLLTEAGGTLVERLHNQFQTQKVETVPCTMPNETVETVQTYGCAVCKPVAQGTQATAPVRIYAPLVISSLSGEEKRSASIIPGSNRNYLPTHLHLSRGTCPTGILFYAAASI